MERSERILIDTNILVDALRGFPAAERYLARLEPEEVFCSVISIAELWAGADDHDKPHLELFLGAFRIQSVDEEIAKSAGEFAGQYGKSHGLLLPDALIAATALRLKATLHTRNKRHFPMKEVLVHIPY